MAGRKLTPKDFGLILQSNPNAAAEILAPYWGSEEQLIRILEIYGCFPDRGPGSHSIENALERALTEHEQSHETLKQRREHNQALYDPFGRRRR